jgi:conflict system STAND superfamily ATPase
VIILDQFEVLFTLGGRLPDVVDAFRDEIGNLAENSIPADLDSRIDSDEALAGRFNLRSRNYKLLISLREDSLPDLEEWRQHIPAVGRSRIRLRPLRREDAFDAVYQPAAHLLTEDLARRVVGIIAGEHLHGERDDTRADAVEPALLSLLCRELNEERKRRGQSHIDERLVHDAQHDVLSNYYSSCVRDLPPRVAQFIESELITERGFRNSYIREDAVPSFLTEDELDQLIRSRLVTLTDLYGAQRIELTHDVLTNVVREHRDRRRADEEKAALVEATAQLAQEERQREELLKEFAARSEQIRRYRRALVVFITLTIVFAVSLLLAVVVQL